ncbi:prepilin-type N-terminal cleavage/methylation domain-containing protein [Microaerobacter geothermalis]|uniref:competence type IV pilus minor pilin ComGD n=1 Tax=Microaerobacter geothermalis TaxID=674972 RepID=UPI001F3DD3FF|nr:competence type IV pilus minor pilin ComGD [Microaerobacter geothermalis]MCF6094208.1 prepilin-type N-terminal cleavage/methylation domain-containing protein [Microaerobacter geothermalis]
MKLYNQDWQFVLSSDRSPDVSKGERGFTLLELTVVLSILTIFLSLVLPSIETTYSRWQTKKLVEQIEADLTFARLKAQANERSIEIKFVPTGYYYWVKELDGTKNEELKRIYYSKDITISTNYSYHIITFNSFGHVYRGGVIDVADKTGKKYRFTLFLDSGVFNLVKIS